MELFSSEDVRINNVNNGEITESDIDLVLSTHQPYQRARERIENFIKQSGNTADSVTYIKQIYGTGGGTIDYSDSARGVYDYNPQGYRFTKGNAAEVFLTWKQVRDRISRLIEHGEYSGHTAQVKSAVKETDETEQPQAQTERQPQTEKPYRVGDEVYLDDGGMYRIERIETNAVTLRALGLNSSFVVAFNEVETKDFERPLQGNIFNQEIFNRSAEAKEPVAVDSIGETLNAETQTAISEPIVESPIIPEIADVQAYSPDKFLEELKQQRLRNEREAVSERRVPIGDARLNESISRLEREITREREEQKTIQANEANAANVPPKIDFRITNNDLGTGSPKTKYKNNVLAIQTLRSIEEEERLATSEEQEILSKYVSWGSIPQVFDSRNSSWSKEHEELSSLLTEEEYKAARATTINAFYTSPTVIKAMYEGLGNMGFTGGNILEPSMGIGNFFGLIPEDMKNSTTLTQLKFSIIISLKANAEGLNDEENEICYCTYECGTPICAKSG
jgi:hypothetical protein